MIVWALIAAVLLGVAGFLWRWAKPSKAATQFTAAFLMLGLAGYAWQGRPDVAAAPLSARTKPVSTDGSVRRFVSSRFGVAGETLGYSDAWLKAGRPDLAVRTIKIGLMKAPNSPDLWLALGGALSAASDGVITPAAQYAFARARNFAPQHPGVLFFDGLYAAQTDDVAGAAKAWMALYNQVPDNVRGTPADPPWRSDVEMRLIAIARMAAVNNPAENAPN